MKSLLVSILALIFLIPLVRTGFAAPAAQGGCDRRQDARRMAPRVRVSVSGGSEHCDMAGMLATAVPPQPSPWPEASGSAGCAG